MYEVVLYRDHVTNKDKIKHVIKPFEDLVTMVKRPDCESWREQANCVYSCWHKGGLTRVTCCGSVAVTPDGSISIPVPAQKGPLNIGQQVAAPGSSNTFRRPLVGQGTMNSDALAQQIPISSGPMPVRRPIVKGQSLV